MIRPILPILAAVMAAATAGCAGSQQALHVTRPHSALQGRGSAVIGERLNRDLLSSLVVEYINLYRNKRNLPFLAHENKAAEAALWMANYQSANAVVTHYSTDSGMRRFGDRYRRIGGGNYSAGYENTGWYPLFDPQLERNYTYDEMARNIVDGWINSPSHHKALIVKADGDGVIGLGVCPGDREGTGGIFATMNAFFYLPQNKITYTSPAQTQQPTAKPQGTTPQKSRPSAKKPRR